MAKLTAKYETVMVFSMQNGEDNAKALAEKFTDLISKNGTITHTDTWGQRALAYPINDETVGYYVVVQFTSDPAFPAELDRVYKITDGVLRTLIVTPDEELEKAKAAKAKAAEAAAQAVQAAPAAAEETEAPAPAIEEAAAAPEQA